MNTPQEAELLPPSNAVAVREQNAVAIVEPPRQSLSLFGTQEPVEIVAKASAVASALKDVIVKQGLVSKISGKEYPRCEAWTLLGTMLGIFPVLAWSKEVEGGWEARVEAKMRDGSIVGAAEAQCLRGERNWKDRDDFALRSMAQTRATAKALRMPLGFVMTLAGYEATPAEEMTFDRSAPAPAATPPRPAPAPKAAPKAAPSGPPPAAKPNGTATAAHRERMVKLLAGTDNAARQVATEFMQKLSWLMPNEALEDLPLQFVPTSKEEMDKLVFSIQMFAGGQAAVKPYEAHVMPLAPKTAAKPAAAAKPIEVPRDNKPAGEVPDEWFMKVVCPVPHAGEKRDEYLKHPDTIGSLYAARHDDEQARKRLFGFLYHYEAKGWKKRDGTEMPANDGDLHFRDALDAFGKWFEENHPDEVSNA